MMPRPNDNIKEEVRAYCSKIGSDPLLVQGAGGNASWKDKDILWIKASGTWLADADIKNIFIPVQLGHLQKAIARDDFALSPVVTGHYNLKPSIETLLHALMPHKVVIHIHAVEILAHLVRSQPRPTLERLVAEGISWIYVDYFKPGPELARAVWQELIKTPDADVIFLGSHGVVIGGDSVDHVASTLHILQTSLRNKLFNTDHEGTFRKRETAFLERGYIPCDDITIHGLACHDTLSARLFNEWALYPDHVVFLGNQPAILRPQFNQDDLDQLASKAPPFIFSIGDGVYQSRQATIAQKMQLRCYYDVIVRQNPSDRLSTLSDVQIADLLDWDAEKYRQNLAIPPQDFK